MLLQLLHTSPFHREVRIRRFTSQLGDLTSSGFGAFGFQQKSSFLVGFSTMVGSTPGPTSFTETSSHVRTLAVNIAQVFWKLTHIFVDYPCAQEIWHRLSFTLHDLTLRRPWDFDLSYPLPEAVRVDMMLLILWHIWKARNAMIFEHQHHSSSDVLRRVVQDIDSWSCRFRRLLTDINVWRDWIVNC